MNETPTDLPALAADPVIPWRDSFVTCSREFERLSHEDRERLLNMLSVAYRKPCATAAVNIGRQPLPIWMLDGGSLLGATDKFRETWKD